MKHLLFLLFIGGCLVAQSPVKETLAYSRNTIPGTPGGQNPFPASYFIYVIVKKDTPVLVTGVCLQGNWYDATLKKVEPPVAIDHDPGVPTGEKDILVKSTADTVYQVEIQAHKGPGDSNCAENKLAQQYPVVVYLKSGRNTWYGLVRTISPLHPAAAM